jgi:hypothetical protein
MKKLLLLQIVALGFFAQACAQLPAAPSAQGVEYDKNKVATIERYALRNNMQVIWINYPRVREQ